MALTRLILAPLAAALLLAGCTHTYVSPVSVTRFVGAEPTRLGQGRIEVRPAPGEAIDSIDYDAFANAVAAQLERLGYRVVPGATSSSEEISGRVSAPQVAEIRVIRTAERPEKRHRPVSVGVGGETGSYGSGVGLGVGIDLSGPPPKVTSTQMSVFIRDTATRQSLWEGRAEFSASNHTPYESEKAAAQAMASALFAGFPGESGRTVEVPVPKG